MDLRNTFLQIISGGFLGLGGGNGILNMIFFGFSEA
jgi:hypothetical protein